MFDLIPGAAGLEIPSQSEAEITGPLNALLSQAATSGQRRTLVLAGEPPWCRQLAKQAVLLSGFTGVTWVTSSSIKDSETAVAGEVIGLLGQERDVVIFDAHSGFDPDAFGAVSGVVRGGGLLILLCPPLADWEHVADPASERIAISPYHFQDISGRFIRRLVKVLRQAEGICLIERGKPLPSFKSDNGVMTETPVREDFSSEVCRTSDQARAVEAIEHVVHGHRRRPAVLISDRGRGKSAALGIAAARLVKNAHSRTDNARGYLNIVVTAPRHTAVEPLFLHARQLLPQAQVHDNCLQWKESTIKYIAPDALCASQETADLVLVDEAAAIPTPILTRLLERYSRIVFATTVHGYEGTGRGFAVRFRQILDENTPGWSEVLLTQPIRWAENDPLEELVFRSLLLNAEVATDELVAEADINEVSIERVDRDALVEDEQTLSQLFGLLVSAHYQTTPNDLRNLLDGPGVSVYVMRSGDKEKQRVIATALVSSEGNFSDELADAILNGQRRPRGHLIPQSLVAHMGIRQAASLRYARIMRIAVHPVLQRKGFGTRLIRYVRSTVEGEGFHFLGTSFGATPALVEFWKAQGLLPVRVGFRRDHASGEYSVMMLRSLDNENNKGLEVFQLAQTQFCSGLPHWLSDPLREMDYAMVLALLSHCEYKMELTHDDRQMLAGFVDGARSYEDSSAILWHFSLATLSSPGCLSQSSEYSALVAKVVQKRSWHEVVTLCGCSGRKEVISLLRSAVASLLNNHLVK